MTVLCNDPATFTEDATAGLVSAYARYITRVPDTSGVVRASGPDPGGVALVIGGGSGHYPAFAGLVGPGMATGAVIGNIFTSPSAEQAYRVARAADTGAGVLFGYGNYSGDVMHFGAAQERLRREGVDCRTVVVTDDIASAPPERAGHRRGIAGDFTVFKTAGAAADRGDDLDEVERLASKANARTRTMGVAFDGCTLPGQREQLFTVAPDRMDIGLGIHGEPGIRTIERVSAAELARVLVTDLLAERPGDGTRAAVILNGLGATKYEELFAVWSSVAPELGAAGVEVIQPEVGELVTSLDMRGVSLTACWLDEELEELWRAGADTPGYRKGTPATATPRPGPTTPGTTAVSTAPERPSRPVAAQPAERTTARDAGRGGAAAAALVAMRDTVGEHAEELGRLDAVAGDGDHGRGMLRGLDAACAAAARARQHGADAGAVLVEAGDRFAMQAGGASGALWGALLTEAGTEISAAERVDAAAVCEALSRGQTAVMRLGGAAPGDKTLVDALAPFVTALGEQAQAGAELADAWERALPAARAGVARTAEMWARRGRSAALAQRGVGTPDPGATSLAYCLAAVGTVLRAPDSSTSKAHTEVNS